MINVSNEFLELMKTRTDFKEYADITFTDGTTLSLEAKDFTIGNNSLNETSDSDSLPLGSTISRKIKICLMNNEDQYSQYNFVGAVIRLYLKFELSNSVETVEFGTFTVTDPETYGVTVQITAYDDFYKADKKYSTGLTFPQTAGAVLRDICTTCGISLYSASFHNDDYVIQEKPSSDYTFRQVIGWVAMIAAGNSRMNRSGALEIITYDFSEVKKIIDGGTFLPWTTGDNYDGGTFSPWTTGDTLDGGTFGYRKNIHVLHAFKNLTVDTDDIVITGISMADNEENILYGKEGYVLSVDNPLVNDKIAFTKLLGDMLIGSQFRKFSGDHISYPIAESMDPVIVIDRKGNAYPSIITDVNFVFYGFTTLKNSAVSAVRNSSKYNSQNISTFVKSKELIEKNKTEFEKAIEDLSTKLGQTEGSYTTIETLADGSKIFYLHNKPTVAESQMIWKMTAEAWGVSTDGGTTWNAGMTVDGVVIAKILNTIGVNADWINTGAITIKDNAGNEIFTVDKDTNRVYINAEYVTIGGKSVTQAIADVESTANNALTTANNAQALSIVMSNEYQGVPTDANGVYTTFPTVTTKITTYFGHTDVSGACSYSVSTSSGITGSWNSSTRVYTVTALTADTAYVDITATYLNTFTVTKRFTVAKVKAGQKGDTGATGATGQPGRTYFLQPSTLVVKVGADGVLSPTTVSFSAYYRDGASATRTAYAGRFKIYESKDGTTFTLQYTSSADESSVQYTPSSYKIASIRCVVYASGGTSNALDSQTVSFLIDVDNLTQEEIFNILTDNGTVQGIYLEGGKIYINASYIQSGTLSASLIKGGTFQVGGTENTYGKIEVYDSDNTLAIDLSKDMLRFFYEYSAGTYYLYLSKEGLKLKQYYGDIEMFLGDGISVDSDEGIIDAVFHNLTTQSSLTVNTIALTSGTTAIFNNNKIYRLSSSSERYKEIERTWTDEDVENLYNIEVYLAKYKDDYLSEQDERYQKYMPMFIVEDMEQYLPIAVNHNDDGTPEMWNSQIMIPVMFQMLKSQKNKIDSLQTELTELKNLLSTKGVI